MILLPQPKELTLLSGIFRLNPDTKITLLFNETLSLDVAINLKEKVLNQTGLILPITKVLNEEKNSIILTTASLGEEEYLLEITNTNITIKGGSEKAVFYGVETLNQLLAQFKTELPALSISDKPYFKVRGFYHDITRGEIPTLETFKKLIDVCASFKINQIQFYVEHSFAYKDFVEVWSDVEPLSAEEILILDEYCKKRHIELVPSIATFGHLFRLLTTKSYGYLSELENSENDPFSFVGRMRHHTLDVSNPESIAVVERMINEFLPLFSSNLFNICADETFDLGKGKNKEKADTLGVGRLYVDFINKIINLVKKHGKRVMMWDDIITKHPEFIDEVPEDVIFLHWDYQANPKEDTVKLISASGHDFYQCPATWVWNQLLPRIRFAHQNILNTVKYGTVYKPVGILNTNWGDYGQINFLSSAIPGLVQGACYSWNPDALHDLTEINTNTAKLYYNDSTGTLLNLITEASDLQLFTFGQYVNYVEGYGQINLDITYDKINSSNQRLNEILSSLVTFLPVVPKDLQIDIYEMMLAVKGIMLFNKLLHVMQVYEGKLSSSLEVNPQELANEFDGWFYEYTKLWRARNRESELHRLRDVFRGLTRRIRSY